MTVRTVLFVCTQNAGRSQMAAGFLNQLGGGEIVATSAGTEPADALYPVVIAAMLEQGVDLREAEPAAVSLEAIAAADLVITLGADLRGLVSGSHFADWDFPSSADSRLAQVRPIRDAIRDRVVALLAELKVSAAA